MCPKYLANISTRGCPTCMTKTRDQATKKNKRMFWRWYDTKKSLEVKSSSPHQGGVVYSHRKAKWLPTEKFKAAVKQGLQRPQSLVTGKELSWKIKIISEKRGLCPLTFEQASESLGGPVKMQTVGPQLQSISLSRCRVGPGICTSTKFPGNADAAGFWGTYFENHWFCQ